MKGNKLSVNKTKKEGQHDVTFVEGGKGHMFPKQSAAPLGSGVTAKTARAASGGGGKFATGGKTKMFGFSGSQAQQPGRTSAR